MIDYFDRVVLLNLKRRPERLADCVSQFSGWPFWLPEVVEAIDGRTLAIPKGWHESPGAYGCLLSHRLILDKAIRDGVNRLLILEDDFRLCEDFAAKVTAFLESVPCDWDGLMLGGTHEELPKIVSEGVVRCVRTRTTHAYAVQGAYMGVLCAAWSKPTTHCDVVKERLDNCWRVYAPQPFLITQRPSGSDIMPEPDYPWLKQKMPGGSRLLA